MATEKSSRIPDPDDERGVYGISVTADLVGTGVQNLRLYERRGLLLPTRSTGGTRLYSVNDVGRLRRIMALLADGLNLAGIAMVLDLQDDNTRMRTEIARGRDDTRNAARVEDSEAGGIAADKGDYTRDK